MNIYILLGLNAVTLFMLLFLYIKQILTVSRTDQASKRTEEQLSQLAKQSQEAEQQLRENLLVNLNTLQQAMLEKLGQSRLEQNQHSGEVKEQLQQAFSA